MKRIILPGNQEGVFMCEDCGCIFSSDDKPEFDYTFKMYYFGMGTIQTCKCPQCSGMGCKIILKPNYVSVLNPISEEEEKQYEPNGVDTFL